MSGYIDLIGQLKPINNQKFAIADVNDLKGGYIQVEKVSEMTTFNPAKIKEGMLCYVKEGVDNQHMFQFINGNWIPWVIQGNGGEDVSIKTIDTLQELEELAYEYMGQIVFVNEVNELRYFNGATWASFSKYYVQDTPPTDLGGIWIDTSENKEHLSSNTVIQELLQVINVLEAKVKKLEFAFQSQIDLGNFENNKFRDYDGHTAVEPEYGTSEEEDIQTQKEFLENGISTEIEPIEYNSKLPNAKHLCIKSGTYSEMIKNQEDFLPKELLWCYDRQQLWIKDPKTYKLIQIGSAGIGELPPEEEPTIPDYMEGILTEVIGSGESAKTKITGIEFADMSNKDNSYLISIKNGKLDVHDCRLDKNILAGNAQTSTAQAGYFSDLYFPIPANEVGTTRSPKIFINMVYRGADNDEYSYCPVSHNFVELSNTGNKDLNLKGLYLHYTEGASGKWITLPLIGTIKAGSTFFIKGAQCSVTDVNTTYIKVGEPDMVWTKDITLHPEVLEVEKDETAGVQAHSIWNTKNEIKFADNCAFYLSAADSSEYFEQNVFDVRAPYSSATVIKWYIDLVGFGKRPDGTAMSNEKAAFPISGKNILAYRYYVLDPASQATKALSARDNSKDFYYIDFSNLDPATNFSKYVPKNSAEGKTIFFNKNLLKEGKPNIITCSLGYNAHTTRCFNWVSVGYYDEFIKVWKEGEEESSARVYESFKEGDGREAKNNRDNAIYNRIRSITTDGTAFTTHKLILDFEEPVLMQKYYYKVGREGAWSDQKSFTLRSRQSCITDSGFNFLHISDHQGFNSEEYETWRVCAELINSDKSNNPYHFTINTGDATQSGNRINEWLDYFTAGEIIFKDTEQMYTVGNNDLCPLDIYMLGDGSEPSKANPINVEYFFTFELPFEIPTAHSGRYIPCVYSFIYGDTYFLSVNSEISDFARTNVFQDPEGVNIYDNIKTWCENDVARLDTSVKWKVAYCHEAPFTIITADQILKYVKSDGEGGYIKDLKSKRGGSRINTVGNYWFSQFMQNNGFKLCLCGHKHTYSNSRYIVDDPELTMEPLVYCKKELVPQEDGTSVADWESWYRAIPAREKNLMRPSADSTLNYVRYVMAQATGFKLISNKELPAQNIPWLMHYYPVVDQKENQTTNTATVKVNTAQQFPNYIIWNVGKGKDVESGTELPTTRERIMGKSYKITKKGDYKTLWSYKYNVPIAYTDLEIVDGNGSGDTASNKIIIEKQL